LTLTLTVAVALALSMAVRRFAPGGITVKVSGPVYHVPGPDQPLTDNIDQEFKILAAFSL